MALRDLLVYVDESEGAFARLRLAADLARRHSSRLTALSPMRYQRKRMRWAQIRLLLAAFGHPKLWEKLMGGVTRDLLSGMTLPILMSLLRLLKAVSWRGAASGKNAARINGVLAASLRLAALRHQHAGEARRALRKPQAKAAARTGGALDLDFNAVRAAD